MYRKVTFLIAFCLIGFSSLVYEVIWARQLSLVFGTTIYAISVTLAAFMAGLGLGSLCFGKIADRSKNILRLFGLTQVITGVSAFLITIIIPILNHLYPTILRYSYPPFFIISLLSFLFSFLLIFIPTFLIGGSFPLIAKIYIKTISHVGPDLGTLYAVNTLGSVVGGLVTSFILIGLIGITKTVLIAALINILIGAGFLLTRTPHTVAAPTPAVKHQAKPHTRALFNFLLFAIALSGFAALGYEVIWTRVLAVFIQNSAYGFAVILAAFLAGIVIGGILYAKIFATKVNQLILFALLETILGLYCLTLSATLPQLPRIIISLGSISRAEATWSSLLVLQFVAIFMLFLPATVILGIVFPMVVRMVTQDLKNIGNRIGVVYGANTIGAIIGSLAAGFLIIPWLGSQIGNKFLAWLNIIIGLVLVIFFVRPIKKSLTFTYALALLLAIFFSAGLGSNPVLPPSLQLGFGAGFHILYYKETPSGTVVMAEEKQSGTRSCYVNNSAVCGTTYDALKAVRSLGTIPMLVHTNPRKVLIIGFGLGVTTSTVAQFDVDRVDCVEICPAVAEASHYFAAFNQNVLRNPKVKLIKGDGRNYLLLTREKYDVISCDPTHPLLGCGSLYTREYFSLCRQRLNPSGVVCQYLPLHKISLRDFEAIIKSFHEVFPHTTIWLAVSHGILVGRLSDEPLDFEILTKKLDNINIKNVLEPVNLGTPIEFISTFIMDEPAVTKFVRDARSNTDDWPQVEFSGRRSLEKETWFTNMTALINFRRSPQTTLANMSDEEKSLLEQHLAGKYFMYRGLINQNKGLINEARQDFYQGMQINPEDKELELMLERVGGY